MIDKAAALPNAKERALLGKARLLEATSDGDLKEAISAYEAFAAGFPESVWSAQVKSRIESLKSGDAGEFYAWFSKQTPKPEDRPNPQDGLPAGHPELPVSLPQIPDELVPADWSEIDLDAAVDSQGAAPAETAKEEKPAAETSPADDATPETEKSNEE